MYIGPFNFSNLFLTNTWNRGSCRLISFIILARFLYIGPNSAITKQGFDLFKRAYVDLGPFYVLKTSRFNNL